MSIISSAMVIVTISPPNSGSSATAFPAQSQWPTPHPFLPISGIIGIAVGSFFTLIICLLLLCSWLRRPRRRKIPTPSLPMLEDSDFEKETLSQDSPLFGPNERFSQRAGLNPTWSWVTFPQNKSETRGMDEIQMKESSVPDQQFFRPPLPPPEMAVTRSRLSSSSRTSGTPVNHSSHPSLQQIQAAVTRATNRMSTVSFEYGSNALKNRDTVFTGDDEITKRRSKSLRKSRRISIYEDRRGISRSSIGLAYDGADVASPVPALDFMPLDSPDLSDDNRATGMESRTRIQAPYYTSAYPRMSSAIPTTYGVATRVKLGEMKGGTSGQPKSESQRVRETRALTRAIGLASPQIEGLTPSPQPTLYPDDSLSVVESKQLLKQRIQQARGSIFFGDDRHFHQVSDMHHQYVVATPTRNFVAVASGSLVSAEDIKALSSGKSGAGLGMEIAVPGSANALGKKGLRGDDRPPRVPSPPPLPSLAQMALEHGNPEGYADYRSPTYSIYNLYENDRKSTVRGERPQG
ncbi:hypothetical protein AGABI2DRAFT_115076 [Agaricus bisporus var. bisporus H97]|uniref:hypothetical protein n=1 Tax=Agaricus bisporus var. bisporus (strain H97 / ATCC MYA-4626 / FGSC 10389) TaxID=936046 RepID=UPI00029F8029|nr:hypothetical protein AGABI2DRAFT_115076 [Agaricus bisporus var. bisporus H97]EKV50011.1 hypothetical protein AGABI2DRAFT_115076 [Agaricus bisporus var. bisporus H97]